MSSKAPWLHRGSVTGVDDRIGDTSVCVTTQVVLDLANVFGPAITLYGTSARSGRRQAAAMLIIAAFALG
jgi:hypothetical protein